MVFYTSKELVDWIQSWAEHQELTVLRHPAPHSPQLLPASPAPAGGPAPGRAAVDGQDRSAVMLGRPV